MADIAKAWSSWLCQSKFSTNVILACNSYHDLNHICLEFQVKLVTVLGCKC